MRAEMFSVRVEDNEILSNNVGKSLAFPDFAWYTGFMANMLTN